MHKHSQQQHIRPGGPVPRRNITIFARMQDTSSQLQHEGRASSSSLCCLPLHQTDAGLPATRYCLWLHNSILPCLCHQRASSDKSKISLNLKAGSPSDIEKTCRCIHAPLRTLLMSQNCREQQMHARASVFLCAMHDCACAHSCKMCPQLQNVPAAAKCAHSCKMCPQLQNVPAATRCARSCKMCPQLRNAHAAATCARSCKMCPQLQNAHAAAKCACSCQMCPQLQNAPAAAKRV